MSIQAEKDELLKQLAETQERASQLDNLRTELSEAQVSAQASQASQVWTHRKLFPFLTFI